MDSTQGNLTPKEATIQIEEYDNEIKEAIDNLVQMANDKGYKLKKVTEAVNRRWKIMYLESTDDLSQNESALCEKAKSFLRYYASDISKVYKISNGGRAYRFKQFYACTAAVLIAYENGERLTKDPINRNILKYFKEDNASAEKVLPVLAAFVLTYLSFEENGRPKFITNNKYSPATKLVNRPEYLEFKKKNKNLICNSKYSRYALALCWVITKYF